MLEFAEKFIAAIAAQITASWHEHTERMTYNRERDEKEALARAEEIAKRDTHVAQQTAERERLLVIQAGEVEALNRIGAALERLADVAESFQLLDNVPVHLRPAKVPVKLPGE